jgi:uncharacterized protein
MFRPSPLISVLAAMTIVGILSLATVLFVLSEGETATIPNFGELSNGQETWSQNVATTDQTEPTAVPFQELTIPYLRSKEYQSSLSDLRLISETSQYRRFLTSYTSDGLQVNGLLTQPKSEMPPEGWPAIIFVHGYIAPNVYRTQERYLDHVDALAENGFVVFKIDLRGHDQSEGEANGAYYSSDYVSDVLHAYSALQTASFIDDGSIGLWGHSMAGNVVMRSVAVKPSIPAAVIWAGAVYSYQDLQKYGLSDASYRPPSQTSERQRRREALFAAHGEFSADSPFWQQVAPTNYVADFQTAVQLHHAVNDDVVSVEYSRDLKTLLEPTDLEFEVHEYPQGGHNLTGSTFNTAMQRTVEFFKNNL